jgi:hypothetical protein
MDEQQREHRDEEQHEDRLQQTPDQEADHRAAVPPAARRAAVPDVRLIKRSLQSQRPTLSGSGRPPRRCGGAGGRTCAGITW